MGDAVKEIRRAVDRIDNPALVRVFTFDRAAFFHQEAEPGTCLVQFLVQNFFGAFIRFRHEIAGPFAGNLQLFDFAEIAHQQSRRLAGGIVHYVNKGGRHRHCVFGFPAIPGPEYQECRQMGRYQSLARST